MLIKILLASSAEKLQEMVTIMNEAFKRKGKNVNLSKTKDFERDDIEHMRRKSGTSERFYISRDFVF